MPTSELSQFIANLSGDPGVYRMLDDTGTVLYVGKASHLKKRVSSYFTQKNTAVKTRSLVSQIASIEVSITRTETEALLLESSLIKALRPKYNVLLRDDKSYPYLHVDMNHQFPRIEMIRSKKKPQKGLYFGPYPSVLAVRETLNIIQKVFKIRNCSDTYFNARSRPCLQYQIQRCTAPCTAYISSDQYKLAIQDAIKFLQGKCQLILDELALRMENAVGRLAFEEAAHIRDQIKSLRLVQERQGVVQQQGDVDAIAMEASASFACVQCVSIRRGQIISNHSFFPEIPKLSLEGDNSNWQQQVLEAFIAFYYVDNPERIPALLLLEDQCFKLDTITNLLTELRKKKCQMQTKPRGVNGRWLDFARNNLRLAVEKYQASKAARTVRYQTLGNLLQIDHAILRMECFDISHTQGESTVASCVVFNEDGPDKKEYRRFNIQGITPGDDYAAMEQALTRRFNRPEMSRPDLLIIDGGKGQVEVARRVLEQLHIEDVRIIGVAKGAARKVGWERLILCDLGKEITLPSTSPALHLLQHIRDEAHRFAITAHRNKRQKLSLESSLETIEGVGPKRRHALLARFGGIRELSRAPLEEIIKVTGINAALALRIFKHFHP